MLPYTILAGVPTMTDYEVISLYKRMEAERTLKWFFYSGGFDDEDAFLGMVKTQFSSLYVMVSKEDRRPLTVIMLDGFRGRTAYIHLVSFKETWGRDAESIAREGISELLEDSFDQLYGLVPLENSLAINFAEQIGGIRMTPDLPKGAWSAKTQKSTPAALFLFLGDEDENSKR